MAGDAITGDVELPEDQLVELSALFVAAAAVEFEGVVASARIRTVGSRVLRGGGEALAEGIALTRGQLEGGLVLFDGGLGVDDADVGVVLAAHLVVLR